MRRAYARGVLDSIEDTLKVHTYWRNVQGLRVEVFVVCCLLCIVQCLLFGKSVLEYSRQATTKTVLGACDVDMRRADAIGVLDSKEDTWKVHMSWLNVQGLRVRAFVVCFLGARKHTCDIDMRRAHASGVQDIIEDTFKVHMYWRNVQGLRVKVFVVCCLMFVVWDICAGEQPLGTLKVVTLP